VVSRDDDDGDARIDRLDGRGEAAEQGHRLGGRYRAVEDVARDEHTSRRLGPHGAENRVEGMPLVFQQVPFMDAFPEMEVGEVEDPHMERS
jgi:hypothetical protein